MPAASKPNPGAVEGLPAILRATEPARAPALAVDVRGASKTYRSATGPNGVRALEPIDLQVRDGEFTTLLGPDGCGRALAAGCAALAPHRRQRAVVADQPSSGTNSAQARPSSIAPL